ncbi:Calcium-binding EF-hand family protein [Klebsormidium nitens]|uniref:Calcium-binding EF-hand family protein n=1 Tax=Klebsormidium nitens TaxID=105231 RepID=A0A1Y1I0G1_KLENI|nr:Calcium-binding EF-hand family protein [Klebsormidium nitens]|eukprot:GAQ84394.1 Calcium-binding EF-hand family protein [Klebsormidium nitens]
MGCIGSKNVTETRRPPGYEEPEVLASETAFSVSEVEALYTLFTKVSNSIITDGLIHKEEFMQALFKNSNTNNLFAERVFELFDIKRNGVIEFGEFVRSLSVFHPRAPTNDKLAFAFKLYDLRQTGTIDIVEVEMMLTALMKETPDLDFSDEVIRHIVEQTFAEADTNQDGKIDQEEWAVMVEKHPNILKNMTLPSLRDITSDYPSFIFQSGVDDAPMDDE